VGDAQRRDLVVDEAPYGFGVLDAFAIQTDPLGHLRVAAQVETESAQTHFPGSPEAVGLAAGDPQRRMGFLHRLGNDRARRDPIEAPLVGKGVLRPHAGNHGDGFFPLGSGLLGVDLEAVHFDEGGGPPGP